LPDTCHRRARAGKPALALALALLVSGCAGADDWLQTHPDVAERARRDPAAVAAQALRQWDQLRAVVGSWQVRASRGIHSRTLDTQIYLRRDALVQIEVMPPTMRSEGFVGVSSSEVGMWVSEDPCLYRGPNRPGAFGRALGIDLTPEDIVAVLMGFAVPYPERAAVSWDESERRIRVSGSGTTAWLHPVTMRFERFVVSTAAGPITGRYEEWMEGDVPVPRRTRVEVASEDITLQLRLADAWNPNPEGLDDAWFDELPLIATSVDCALETLTIDGGLLRRGLGR